MKSLALTAFFTLFLLLFSVEVYARGVLDYERRTVYGEDYEENTDEIYTEKTAENKAEENKKEDEEKIVYIEYEESESKPKKPLFFFFNEGATAAWLTRIILQTERSNFVFEDFLPGLYFGSELVYFSFFKPMVRIAVYYPLASTFNDIPQIPKSPLHIGADLTAGVKFELFTFDYLRLNLGPAFHVLFLTSDRWTYLNMGAVAFIGIEVPIAEKWTILLNGFASLDSGNVGGNKLMEPFDITYQYQVDIGVRYSKKNANKTFIFPLNSRHTNENEIPITVSR